jgi:hypothetical protein
MWNQSKIRGLITPTLARPGQPSVKAVTSVVSLRPTVPRVRWINAVMSDSVLVTAPRTLAATVNRLDVADAWL